MSYPPSMVHKSGNQLVVRSVVSGDKLFGTSENEDEIADTAEAAQETEKCAKESLIVPGYIGEPDEELPQCKVKRNYACSSCSYYTQNPRYYLHHLKNVHKEKIRIYECPHCLYASKHSQKLQRHIHMVHVMGKRKLLIKAKATSQKRVLSASFISRNETNESASLAKITHQSKVEVTLSRNLPEMTNSATTTFKADVEAEEETHEGDNHSNRPAKCSLCSFSSRNPNIVTRHERLVHLKKKFYRCTKCDYITHMKARFTKHVKYHSMPMIKCEMCDFRTPYKWNLDRHNKNHFANGAFKCSQCNFTADIKQSLTVHEMNHHVPPVNQNGTGGLTIPTPAKRRCRVGASDIIGQQDTAVVDPDFDELELLRMERESLPPLSTTTKVAEDDDDNETTAFVTSDEVDQMAAVEITMVKPNVPAGSKTLNLKNPTAAAYLNGTLKPEDVILTKNGSVYVKKFKCRVCHYKAAWESEMIRHEVRVHGLDSSAKKKSLPRPIPNLIPIQNNSNGSNGDSSPSNTSGQVKMTSANNIANSSPLKNGFLQESLNSIDADFEKPLSEKDLNDICVKSCETSSLKDFASLIGEDESTLKSDKDFMLMMSEEKEQDKRRNLQENGAELTTSEAKPSEGDSQNETKKLPDSFKKKNATFFDRLKEKLMVGAGETHNLVCWCGHKSKCLSESVLHQKMHSDASNEKNEKSVTNGPLISGAELSSTRCQHCRQRCKTSSDLFAHLQSCPEMIKKGSDNSCFNTSQNTSIDPAETNGNEDIPMDEDGEIDDEPEENDEFVEKTGTDKEGNKVFVWNNLGGEKEESDEFLDDDLRSKSPTSESSLVGYEIAPGIGSVVRSNEDVPDSYKVPNVDIQAVETTTKKVFKCPTCSFWASTASRFHVHIVSHMNVKPFGCSVCPYQSKWKWDVTKHIKLKKERDPLHERAEMRTIDVETGRRNYTKYNRFLTLMRVHEPQVDYFSAPVKSMVASLSPKSQLSTQSSSVPLLPKLTPAPSMNGEASSSATATSDAAMRPLPQLHPANPAVSIKRPHDGSDDSKVPKKKIPSEKKMWKCKKCKFRNTDRNIVLAHVKEHYTSNSQSINDSRMRGTDSEVGNSSNVETSRSAGDHISSKKTIKCDICNFETDNSSTFQAHNRHHIETPSATYICYFCPFYANDKSLMLDHIASHGVQNPEESLIVSNDSSRKDECEDDGMGNKEDGNISDTADSSINKTDSGAGGDEMEVYKRFKCCSCPYVTNNKSQYLYHKQFHRLRGAPFKCNICSYNVTKRHLLHQHLKIHGVKRAQFKNCIKDAVEKETPENGLTLNTDVYTAHLPDIPLVWVHKAGTLTKMFKCRHCPHVNLRKSNIHEHEKMHFDRIQRSPNGSITSNQTSTHRCTECNYVCNNAGALASHFKVHQGTFGQICALADSRRSDESQIREITRMLKEDDRFKKELSKTENNSDGEVKKIVAMTVNIPALNTSRLEAKDVVVSSDGNTTPVTAVTAAVASIPASASNKQAAIVDKVLHFCNVCPARFLFQKDLESHSRFHSAHHLFKCSSCTYSAPQQAQLLAHKRVHSNDYQEKTNTLCNTYDISKEFGRPKTTLILDKPGFAGLGWVVVHTSSRRDESGLPIKSKPMTKQFSCHKCPAQFFKSVALQHHLTLHGGKDQYQCRGCDYRVKTYGNLIKHESVHGLEPRVKVKSAKNKKLGSTGGGAVGTSSNGSSGSFPSSGTELFQHRSEQILKEQSTTATTISPTVATVSNTPLSIDPEFGILMHGSPDFIYPQTVKNGKLKEKRYKCHKCPSAFEKREQYKTHVLLHGAKSRFRCEKCDYSVKYFANYTQHMRKHEMNERCLSERQATMQSSRVLDDTSDRATDVTSTIGLTNRTSFATDGNRTPKQTMSPEKYNDCTPSSTPTKSAAKTLHISVADQQAVVLMQEKISDNGVNMVDQLHRCYYCPYSHQRKDAVENHERCHFNPKGSYVCEFCNYTVPQPHFLREHQKLHFGNMKGVKPEAYMKCDRLEIWMETEEGKVLIFKDSGRKENRFEPPIMVSEDDSEFQKMYVDVKTGEEFTPIKVQQSIDEVVEHEERKPLFDLSCITHKSESSSIEASSTELSPQPVREESIVPEVFSVKEEPLEEDINLHVEEEEEVKEDDFVEEDDEEEVDDLEVEDEEDEPEMTAEFEDDDSTVNEVIEETVEMDVDAEAEVETDLHAELGSTNLDSDAEMSEDAEIEAVAETVDNCDNTSLAEEVLETLEKSNDNEIDLQDTADPEMSTCEQTTDLDENTAFTDVTKTLTDDSDSEDTDSSSSSSCSDSSCSSSDSSNSGSTDDDGKEHQQSTEKEESKIDPAVTVKVEPSSPEKVEASSLVKKEPLSPEESHQD